MGSVEPFFVNATRHCAVAALLSSLFAVAPSFAQTPPTDQALAQTLFDRGRELLAPKTCAEACLMFGESARLDPSVGTELNLGLCYESQGKTASAWAAYRAAGARARRDGRKDREQAARDRATALEPKLARFSIAPSPGSEVPGLEVRLDGTVLGRATWDIAAPIDPGSHVVEARAPGYRTWTTPFDIDAAASRSIVVPALSAASAAMPAPAPLPATSIAVPVVAPNVGSAPPTAAPMQNTAASMPPALAVQASAPGSSMASNGPAARTWVGGRYWLDTSTVEDVKTALTWQRYVVPRGAVWETASAYCGSLRLAGGGWRLPTPIELASLVVPGRMPAMDPQIFPQTPAGWFWTAEHHAWGVAEAISSTTGAKQPVMSDRPLFVRCVR
jgi:hypothetical protein